MVTKGATRGRRRRERRRRARKQHIDRGPPPPRHAERRPFAQALGFFAIGALLIGVVGLRSWTPARVMVIPGGVALMVYGVLTGTGTLPSDEGAAHPHVVALVASLIGLAAVGVGLESVDGPRPWTVLMLAGGRGA